MRRRRGPPTRRRRRSAAVSAATSSSRDAPAVRCGQSTVPVLFTERYVDARRSSATISPSTSRHSSSPSRSRKLRSRHRRLPPRAAQGERRRGEVPREPEGVSRIGGGEPIAALAAPAGRQARSAPGAGNVVRSDEPGLRPKAGRPREPLEPESERRRARGAQRDVHAATCAGRPSRTASSAPRRIEREPGRQRRCRVDPVGQHRQPRDQVCSGSAVERPSELGNLLLSTLGPWCAACSATSRATPASIGNVGLDAADGEATRRARGTPPRRRSGGASRPADRHVQDRRRHPRARTHSVAWSGR